MPTLTLTITDAGLDALVDAQNGVTDAITIAEMGLTNNAFTAAPTLTALPGEFKRLDGIAGQSASANIIHIVAQDNSTDVYDARGLGLYLADGTLFATYAQPDLIVAKLSIASFLIAVDIAFLDAVDAAIDFGPSTFLYPPATRTVRGTAFLATEALADAGVNDDTIMTPTLVKRVVDAAVNALSAALTATLDAAVTAMNATVNALAGRSITGTGLATGGGTLAADRTIAVTASTAAQLQAATDTTTAVPPAAFGALPRTRGATSYEVFPGGTLVQKGQYRSTIAAQGSISITFPVAFADTNYDLQLTAVIPSAGDYDDFVQEVEGTRSVSGVTLFAQDPSSGGSSSLAGFNWRVEGLAA